MLIFLANYIFEILWGFLSNYLHPTTLWSYLYSCIWLVPYFGGKFCLIFVEVKEAFSTGSIRLLFDEKSSSKLYICVCLQMFGFFFFCSFNSYSIIYLLTPFKSINSAHWSQCVRKFQCWPFSKIKLSMTTIQNNNIWNTRRLYSFKNIASIINLL